MAIHAHTHALTQCFPSVIKSSHAPAHGISLEDLEAHTDSPRGSQGWLFSLDLFHETACVLSGNWGLWKKAQWWRWWTLDTRTIAEHRLI